MNFDLAVTVQRPPAVVFALLADIQDHLDPSPASRVPEMKKIPPGPTRVGTRWREVVRVAPGLRMTVWSEVTAMEPGRRLTERFWSSWMRGTLDYTVVADGNGSLLRQRESLRPKGLLRLLDRRIAAMLRPNLVARLEAIRVLLEADERRADDRPTDGGPREGEAPAG